MRGGDAGGGEEQHERRLARAEAVDCHRQQHHQQDDRDEGEVGRERRVDAEREAEAPGLQHPEDLHADRGQRDGAEPAVVGRVALHGADDRRPRGVGTRPGQALHEADQPGRDPRAEHRGGHGGAARRGHRERREDRRPGREIAREPEPDDGHGEERQHAEGRDP